MKRELQLYTVFIGAPTCVYHNAMGMDRAHCTFITPSNLDAALGTIEDLISDEVRAYVDLQNAWLVRIFSTCYCEFVGIDFEALCKRLNDELDIFCWHDKRCRICGEPGKGGPGMGGPSRGGPRGRGFRQEELPQKVLDLMEEFEILGLSDGPMGSKGFGGPSKERPGFQMQNGGREPMRGSGEPGGPRRPGGPGGKGRFMEKFRGGEGGLGRKRPSMHEDGGQPFRMPHEDDEQVSHVFCEDRTQPCLVSHEDNAQPRHAFQEEEARAHV